MKHLERFNLVAKDWVKENKFVKSKNSEYIRLSDPEFTWELGFYDAIIQVSKPYILDMLDSLIGEERVRAKEGKYDADGMYLKGIKQGWNESVREQNKKIEELKKLL